MHAIVQDFLDHWISDWKTSRLFTVLEALGVVTSVIASIIINFGGHDADLRIVISLWLIGSISLMATTWFRRIGNMFILCAVYSLFNVIGLINVLR